MNHKKDWLELAATLHHSAILLKKVEAVAIRNGLECRGIESISKRLEKHTKQWLKADQHAQVHRNDDPSLMDIYDTTTSKGMYMISIELIRC